MKRRVLAVVAIAVMAFGLTGCCISHDWQDATCTQPQTCSKCGKTTGEPLGHEEQGEANYQSGPICSRCGEELGDKLQGDFESRGYVISELGTNVPYITVTQNGYETIGEVALTECEVSETGPHGESVEGYEWLHTTLYFRFMDESAKNDGVKWHVSAEDYYTCKQHDDSLTILMDDPENNYIFKQYTVNYNGVDYDQCTYSSQFVNNGWGEDEAYTASYTYDFCVPVGYDGTVIAVYSGATTWEDGQYIYDVADDNTIFFKVR